MNRALLKKQMMESFSWIYYNRKNGKKRDWKGIIAYVLLYLFIFGMLGYVFYQMAAVLCDPLSGAGFGWLYFDIVGLIAVVLGVFGSVFNTFASLYQAKDNDLLLSMPIPAHKILWMRLMGVYMMGLMYELIVMIPALIVWFLSGSVNVCGVVCSLLIPLVLSVFILTLSCILGWVVALLNSKIKNKSFITLLLSLAFIAGYYIIYFKAYQMLTSLLMNAERIAKKVKTILYPFYHMGLAAEGNLFSMLIFTGMIALLFAIVYLVLSGSFFRLATASQGGTKSSYKERAVKAASADSALLRKEWKRFTGSATYMLNCSLGTLFMLIAAGALLMKGKVLMRFLPLLYQGAEELIPLLITAALCMIVSMNDISAPSISLEGKNLWLVQVLPVSPWQILKAKLKLHLLLTLPPAAVLTACTLIIFQPSAEFLVFIPLCVVLFIILMAMFGLALNLKAPNLNWTNEAVPIKQSLSVTAALFGGWVVVLVAGALYYLLADFVKPSWYLAGVCIFLTAGSVVLFQWLKKKGTRIFSTL